MAWQGDWRCHFSNSRPILHTFKRCALMERAGYLVKRSGGRGQAGGGLCGRNGSIQIHRHFIMKSRWNGMRFVIEVRQCSSTPSSPFVPGSRNCLWYCTDILPQSPIVVLQRSFKTNEFCARNI